MELIEIKQAKKQLVVEETLLESSSIRMSCINGLTMQDVSATNVKIFDANLSDLEIFGAQLGGAYIHSVGMPPEGHPNYEAGAKQRPLKFDDCDLTGSTISNCNLSDVNILDCNLTGMTLNGILVDDLFKAYNGGE